MKNKTPTANSERAKALMLLSIACEKATITGLFDSELQYYLSHNIINEFCDAVGAMSVNLETGDEILKDKIDHYLIHVVGDVEPHLQGPFNTDTERIQKAVDNKLKSPEDLQLKIDVPQGTAVTVDSFTGQEIETEVTSRLERSNFKLAEQPF